MFVETKEAGEIQQAPAKARKLSTLIREGAKLHPQGVGVYFDGEKTCAMGAAYMAEGATDWMAFANRWQRILCFNISLTEIFSRNDRGDTREEIADWLESQGY